MDEELSQLPVESSRFDGPGFFVLDEPESALSFSAQLALLSHLLAVTADGRSQVILSTHSPVLASLPGARVLELGCSNSGSGGTAKRLGKNSNSSTTTADFLLGRSGICGTCSEGAARGARLSSSGRMFTVTAPPSPLPSHTQAGVSSRAVVASPASSSCLGRRGWNS